MFNLASRLKRGGFLCAAALLVCVSASALAELPPYVYRDMQAKSPERLTIKVKSVKTSERDEPDRKRVDVAVLARVTEVGRTDGWLPLERRKLLDQATGVLDLSLGKQPEPLPESLVLDADDAARLSGPRRAAAGRRARRQSFGLHRPLR